MGDIGGNLRRSLLGQGRRGADQGRATVDDVVKEHAPPALYVADDIHHLADPRAGPALVDDGQVGVESVGEGAGANHPADVR